MPPTLAAARNTYCGLLLREKLLHRGGRAQIEFGAVAQQQALRAVRPQPAHEGRAHQAAMAGDEDGRIVHRAVYSRAW